MTTPPSPEFLDLQAIVAGRYSLERELGRGGMGVVFLARDVALERLVAIKLLPKHLAHDPTLRERFLREARTAAQLMHPNIVPIHAVEAHDDLAFFVMAFIDGETLAERVRRKGLLSGDETVRLMQEVAWALGYAHGRGVVHRDIKPDNILIEHASGRALVADFGIARVTQRETLSAEGTLLGTVQYMSPEQAGGEALDARSDVYSLGATAYFALTGASPHEAPTLPAMLNRLVTEMPASVALVRTGLPGTLSDAVMRALAKDRAARFGTADELAGALQQGHQAPREARPEIRAFLREVTGGKVMLTVGLGVLVAGGGALGFGLVSGETATALILTTGFGSLAIFVAAVAGAVGGLRRDRVPWSEVDAAIAREIGDMQEQMNRQLARAKHVRKMFAILGAGLLGMSGVLLFTAIQQYRTGPREIARMSAALTAVTLLVGGTYLVLGLWKRVPLRWLVPESRVSADSAALAFLRRLMRWGPLARFYARGAGTSAVAPSAVPTATLLLQRVQELIDALPAPLRTRLSDVLPAAAGLERAVGALRERVAMLEHALAELPAGSLARAEFTAARERASDRLAECVATLEQVRTDLLRLGAGLIAADGITAELEKAQELSAAIDAELQGLDEVRKLA